MTRFLVNTFLQHLRILVLIFLSTREEASAEHGQHATLGVLVDLHEAVGEVIGTKGPSRIHCGSLNVRAYQQLAAVRWAVEIINNNSWSNEFALNVVAHDTCGESSIAMVETHRLITWSKENIDNSPLIGVIVIGNRNSERIIDIPLETLNKENISAIVTSSRAADLLLTRHFNVFTTALDIASVTESILALIHQLGTDSVAVVSSCSHAVRKFEKLAAKQSIPANAFSILKKDNPLILDAIIHFISNEASSVQTVVLLLDSTDLERLIRDRERLNQFQRLVRRKSWILGSVGMDQELAKEWSNRFHANLLIMQPHVSPNPDFQSYFLASVKEALVQDTMDESREYIEKIHQCQWPESEMSGGMRLRSKVEKLNSSPPYCGNLSDAELNDKFHSDSDVGFIVSAVSAYSAALRLAQLETCTTDEIGCDHQKLSLNVLEALRKLNFPIEATVGSPVDVDETLGPTIAASHELEGTRGRINHQGKLVSRKYDLLLSRPYQQIAQVGQYSTENGLLLDMTFAEVNLSVDTFTETLTNEEILDSTEPTSSISSNRQPKKTKSNDFESDSPEIRQHQLETQVQIRKLASPELYISRVWAMVVVAVGITGVFLALYMLVYVLLRMCDGTLQGNQSLGIILLLCVMLLYATVVIFVLPPSSLLCTLRIFIPSSALSIAFGILLLKAMQLRSLVSLGLGGRISTFNQFVTLLFIVAVQLAINLQWYFTPHTATQVMPLPFLNGCSHSHETYLLLHSYVGLLILFVFLYGTSVLKIRRNYNEARWLTLTALLSLPVVLGWILVVVLGPPEFQEPAPAIFFITIATIILFSIFIPKLGTISRQSSLVRRKQMLHQAGHPAQNSSISTIFTTLSNRGTMEGPQSHHQHHHHKTRHYMHPGHSSTLPTSAYTLSPPPFSSSHAHAGGGKSVTYSPRIATNFHHASSAPTSLTRSISMKTPLYETSRGGYP